MIKIIFLIFLISNILFASYMKKELLRDYKSGHYSQVCKKSRSLIDNIKNEKLLSIIGDACLKIDYINPLGRVIKRLNSTPVFRENASYFATILLQKKLLYQFMNDNIDLKNIRLPKTSHILSIVFENIVKKNYKILDKSINKIEINLDDITYIMWLSKEPPKKIFIEEYKNGKFIKRHWYL